jgi:hypothetical protein
MEDVMEVKKPKSRVKVRGKKLDTSGEKLNPMGKENEEFIKKYTIDWKVLNWIRLAYGYTTAGTLTEEFLDTLIKVKVVCNHKELTANKNAYSVWFGPQLIRFPYGSEVWLNDEIIDIIEDQAVALDANSYHEDIENNVTGRGKLTSTLEYDKLYDVNIITSMEELKK